MKHRLNKADRIRLAGKNNNKAQYVGGKKKRKFVLERRRNGIKEKVA